MKVANKFGDNAVTSKAMGRSSADNRRNRSPLTARFDAEVERLRRCFCRISPRDAETNSSLCNWRPLFIPLRGYLDSNFSKTQEHNTGNMLHIQLRSFEDRCVSFDGAEGQVFTSVQSGKTEKLTAQRLFACTRCRWSWNVIPFSLFWSPFVPNSKWIRANPRAVAVFKKAHLFPGSKLPRSTWWIDGSIRVSASSRKEKSFHLPTHNLTAGNTHTLSGEYDVSNT